MEWTRGRFQFEGDGVSSVGKKVGNFRPLFSMQKTGQFPSSFYKAAEFSV